MLHKNYDQILSLWNYIPWFIILCEKVIHVVKNDSTLKTYSKI